MKPFDILEYRCPQSSIVWQWLVVSVQMDSFDPHVGYVRIRPLVGGFSNGSNCLWVPEPMTRSLKLISHDRTDRDDDPFGIAMTEEEFDREVEEACDELGIPYQEPTHEETRAFRSLMDRIKADKQVIEYPDFPSDAFAFAAGPPLKAQDPHFDADQAESGIEALNEFRTGWRGHANAWRNEVRRMPDGEKLRALGQMRGLVKAIEEEEGVVMDENGDFHRVDGENQPRHLAWIARDKWRALVNSMDDETAAGAMSQMMNTLQVMEVERGMWVNVNSGTGATKIPKPVRFTPSADKKYCQDCKDTGWVPRAANGLLYSGRPFSSNYKPCPNGCDGGRGFSDPIPYDPKTGKIAATGTEDDGA